MRHKALFLTALSASALLAACGDAYRYPCQNPAKANTPECSCTQEPRTKNKALGAVETGATTTTIHRLLGYDC